VPNLRKDESGSSDMRKSEKLAVLANLPLFEHSTKRELALVADITVSANLRAGTVLTREGQVGGLAFVILEGTATVSRGGEVIGTAGPGEMVGELSLIDGKPRSARTEAKTDMHVLQINYKDFKPLVDKSPNFTHNLLRALAGRIRDMDARDL
jgi:CRP/FNR family cyclic AMP-dependent transcriptional regulator